jgi:hypothetical protein
VSRTETGLQTEPEQRRVDGHGMVAAGV